MNKLDMQSTDIVEGNVEKIAQLFPNVVVESDKGMSIDFDLLKQELSKDIVETGKEKYQLTWPRKKEAILNANAPINKTLRPIREKSVNFDDTKNIYIEGDNLEVLKILQESYLNKIKCIYIDPPYNTGNDFIYNDKFNKTEEDELIESGQIDEFNNRMITNNISNGRFHSDWLSMMYSRIKLARNLLEKDGVIFISIDDNELYNLKMICDEIFGENGFITCFTWIKTSNPPSLGSKVRNNMEYILCYEKNFDTQNKLYGRNSNEKDSPLANGANRIVEVKIPAKSCNFSNLNNGIIEKGNKPSGVELLNEIVVKDSKNENDFIVKFNSKWNQENIYNEIANNTFFIIKDFNYFSIRYQKGNIGYVVPDKFLDPSKFDVKDNEYGRKELERLVGKVGFDYPKNTPLIKTLLNMYLKDDKNGTVLDFFSGSATTADSVLQMNANDSGNRKFIMVELPEKCEENSLALKSGYKTICDIGEERIRRAGKKIKEETNANIDYGFRVYKIDSSNMKDVYYKPNDLEQAQLNLFETNVKEDRTNEDLLTQIILDLGLTLDLKIEEKNILSNKVYYVAENSLVACFDKNIDINIIDEICKCKPLKIVFKEECFNTDNLKINVQEKIKKLSPESEVYVL